MKKRISVSMISACLAVMIFSALIFIQVPTKQGINYVVRSYKIPLYVKVIEFLDRDYQYRRIVKEITNTNRTEEEKVVSIFKWCVQNIKHQPKGLAIIDDHQYSIIVRGYGVDDQLEDVFTILCTYAGYEAFYKAFRTPAGKDNFISFVKFDGKWHAFSVWGNAYPKDTEGRPLAVDNMKSDPSSLDVFLGSLDGFEPSVFLDEIGKSNFKVTSVRVRGQSPAGRIGCCLERVFKR